MDFDELAYPEIFTIDGCEYKGSRDTKKAEVRIPYSEVPDVGIGDVISQKSGKREIQLKVVDISFLKGGSLNVGTKHPHMLTLSVENTTAAPHKSSAKSTTYNIRNVSGQQVQVGDNNSQSINISIKELAERVATSNDEEAKSILKSLLSNSTVGSLVGAGASALFALL